MNTKLYTMIGGGVVALAALGYGGYRWKKSDRGLFFWRKPEKKAEETAEAPASNKSTNVDYLKALQTSTMHLVDALEKQVGDLDALVEKIHPEVSDLSSMSPGAKRQLIETTVMKSLSGCMSVRDATILLRGHLADAAS